jgi:transcriptional regulator GlxA family with amidase domain
MARWDFRSQYPDEVQEFLGGVYAENEFKIIGKKGASRTRIYGGDVGEIAQYNVSYTSPFTFLSEQERESFLILSCTAGSANFRHAGAAIEFSRGIIAPISATRESRVKSGDSFAHISTHIDTSAVNALCSKLLGYSLDAPVQFALTPFADPLMAQWRLVVKSLNQLLEAENPSIIAISNLKEYAIALLLENHPHNYSNRLKRRQPIGARAVHDAKHFIEQNADRAITVADVAAFVGCSIGALHDGFCEHLGLAPRAYLYFARMTLARSKLTNEGKESSAAEIAQKCGFVNFSRFETAYKARYNENAAEVFHRHFQSAKGEAEPLSQPNPVLPTEKVELLRHYINASLGGPITVEKLSATVGMSTQSFAASFKRTFNTTPAQYILSERLKWARWLLTNTNASIAGIAAETGFSSQSHLTSALKQRQGETPHELRKSAQLG